MPEDSEKRFHSTMDKLFHAPKHKPPSSSGVQVSRGKKRPISTLLESKTRWSAIEGFQHSSGTVIGSSKAPLCRPWDRDDLMRRLATFKSMTWFAKPKAVSAVNCARRGWINVDLDIIACEACGARLLFSTPSSWTQQQVEKAALVFSLKLDSGHKLLCPWIDNACEERLTQFPPMPAPVLVDGYSRRFSALLQIQALPVISSSAIDHMRSPLLEHFLTKTSDLESCNGSAAGSQHEYTGKELEAVSAKLYYQALKLISLCGWEPRLLPYIVESRDQSNQSSKSFNPLDISLLVTNEHNPNTSASTSSDKIAAVAGDVVSCSRLQSDPNSIVLDCRLCGANVGLWAFRTVLQPIESFRIAQHSGTNGVNDSTSGEDNIIGSGESVVDAAPTGAAFIKESCSFSSLTIAGGPPPTRQNFKATISIPVIGRNLRTRFSSGSDLGNPIHIQSDSQHKKLLQSSSDSIATGDADVVNRNGETIESESGNVVVDVDCDPQASMGPDVTDARDIPLSGQQETSCVESGVEADPNAHDAGETNIREDAKNSDVQNSLVIAEEEGNGLKDQVQIPVNNQCEAHDAAMHQKQLQVVKAMEFDPIQQHRHFCPWIASTGSTAPGWKQTLAALESQKEDSHLPSTTFSSTSVIQVDDPVASIRTLFSSPSAKRTKLTPSSESMQMNSKPRI